MKNRFPGLITELKESPDQRPRRRPSWSVIVIHHTGIGNRDPQTLDESGWKLLFQNLTGWLTTKDKNYLSAHFMIGRGGEVVQMVDPDLGESFHAGESSWWDSVSRLWQKDVNGFGIGIELVGDGNVQGFGYSEAQYDRCAKLCASLLRQYQSITQIVGHEMISPGRKIDPGKAFDWRAFQTRVWEYFKQMGLENSDLTIDSV